jgi:hypothetical protein
LTPRFSRQDARLVTGSRLTRHSIGATASARSALLRSGFVLLALFGPERSGRRCPFAGVEQASQPDGRLPVLTPDRVKNRASQERAEFFLNKRLATEVPLQFVCASRKLRQIFYTQIELRNFHTVWTHADMRLNSLAQRSLDGPAPRPSTRTAVERHQWGIVGRDARMRSEKSGALSAACAVSLISERRRSSSNGSVVSIRPE